MLLPHVILGLTVCHWTTIGVSSLGRTTSLAPSFAQLPVVLHWGLWLGTLELFLSLPFGKFTAALFVQLMFWQSRWWNFTGVASNAPRRYSFQQTFSPNPFQSFQPPVPHVHSYLDAGFLVVFSRILGLVCFLLRTVNASSFCSSAHWHLLLLYLFTPRGPFTSFFFLSVFLMHFVCKCLAEGLQMCVTVCCPLALRLVFKDGLKGWWDRMENTGCPSVTIWDWAL